MIKFPKIAFYNSGQPSCLARKGDQLMLFGQLMLFVRLNTFLRDLTNTSKTSFSLDGWSSTVEHNVIFVTI